MNEELEKIAQDMRKKERELWAGNPPRMGNGAIALMLDGYASRLEVALGLAPRPKCEAAAAAKHEMAKEMSKKLDGNRAITGNAAALRRALEDTEELLEHFAKPGTMLHSAFFLHMRDNRAALAAPPRNCDRFATEAEARKAFYNCYFGPTEEEFVNAAFIDWLFSTAEGGAR